MGKKYFFKVNCIGSEPILQYTFKPKKRDEKHSTDKQREKRKNKRKKSMFFIITHNDCVNSRLTIFPASIVFILRKRGTVI